MKNKYIIFDLDDTLIYEINYLKSAYKEIAEGIGDNNEYQKMLDLYYAGEDVFNYLEKKYRIPVKQLLSIYRNHIPEINLNEGADEILTICRNLNYKLGLITDGRSITQRNKLRSLNIENFFDRIVISEEFGSSKPFEANFRAFMEDGNFVFFYIADNLTKDFITPNQLGWTTICLLDNGSNIHPQNFDKYEHSYLPKYTIHHFSELKKIIDNRVS
jgi:putative hydrolase of the HAD superfamily